MYRKTWGKKKATCDVMMPLSVPREGQSDKEKKTHTPCPTKEIKFAPSLMYQSEVVLQIMEPGPLNATQYAGRKKGGERGK
jgi:hypothetical protein